MKRSRGERRGLPARGGQRLPDVVLRGPGGVAVPDREGKGGRPVPHRPVPARALSGQGARRADVTRGSFRAVKQVLADASDAVEWLPLTVEVAERYEDVPYPDMKDPVRQDHRRGGVGGRGATCDGGQGHQYFRQS